MGRILHLIYKLISEGTVHYKRLWEYDSEDGAALKEDTAALGDIVPSRNLYRRDN